MLVEEKIRQTMYKNTATSFGLTLVVGLPFPAEICNRIRHVQGQLEALAPGRFTWYGADHLHATLAAPLRGRYREQPPLGREELPADLPGFTRDLGDFFAQRRPFSLELVGAHVTPEGLVIIREHTLTQQLASSLQAHPQLDQPKHHRGLHVNIGFFNTVRPFDTDEKQAHFESGLAQLAHTPVGQMRVQQVWLVHYANRTLNRIVGKVPFTLGRANDFTVEHLLRELGIATF
jgi:hypothetical protein